jgi:hypothetical protein
MSLLSWFSAKKKFDPPASVMPSSGLSRLESTKPFNGQAPMHRATAQPANRKQERMERRELLYAVVREAMVRAGVLSSSYKFKVLSLDPRGRQFLVMVDLAHGNGSDTSRLAEIEAMIAQSAKARYDILVTAVYWRANDHVAVGDPAHRGTSSRPAPLTELPRAAPVAEAQRPAPAAERPRPVEAARPAAPAARPRVEPLQDDEVAAFRKALDAGLRGEQALAAANHGKTPQSYTLLTGFEDTEMSEGAGELLSGTQYGALR